ncbi:MAG: C1 family peptidase [Sedimentisphaerales bacterium]|nr:C1 family peptidase [Sedimentisphaerales bacterium]
MADEEKKIGIDLKMGWLPDYPDFRDYTVDKPDITSEKVKKAGQKESVKSMINKMGAADPAEVSIPNSKDLRQWCSPIENQGSLGSCTANAGVGLVEYCERRAFNKHIDASRLFLYKATRNFLHWKGDTGAFLRTTMGAMAIFGVPPEEYWPYIIANYDKEPLAFCYAFAQAYQAIQYFRLDPPNTPKDLLLKRIKCLISANLPSMFGFTVFSSIKQANDDGKIPFPCPGEKILGGHAIVAVGFNDEVRIKNTICGLKTEGALLIRNSWGTGWGEKGYGWLPYEYVLKGLAVDWWALLKNEWINTGNFKV